MHVILQLFGLR